MIKMLNVQEAADLLCVKPGTIRKYVREGKLPAVKLSVNHLALNVKDIERLIKENTVVAGKIG